METIRRILSLHLLPFSKISYLLKLLQQNKEQAIKPPSSNQKGFKVQPKIKCSEILLAHSITHNWLIWVALIYLYLFPQIEQAKTYQIEWVSKIIIRDLLIMTFVFGGWHWVLYSNSSPFKQRVQKDKLTQKYPSNTQVWHDIRGTVSSVLITSMQQIHILYLYANGAISYNPDIYSQLFRFILAIEAYQYIRQTYFYFQHRPLHPWKTQIVPDLGKYLYKYVHYYHHKSWNPGPWDGLSLHPIEGVLNTLVCYIPLLICPHPFIFLFYKYCIIFSAVKSHDGFGDPAGLGSKYHQYHHQKFEVNFGGSLVPFDYWLGEFYDGQEQEDEDIDSESDNMQMNFKSEDRLTKQVKGSSN